MACANDSLQLHVHSTLLYHLENLSSAYDQVHGYVSSMLCLLGLFTNLVHILVLTRPSMRSCAVNVILTAVAICDTGTMLSYLIYLSHFIFQQENSAHPECFEDEGYGLGWIWFLLCHMLISITLHNTSLWLAVTLAFVRNMTLRRIQTAYKWTGQKRAWRLSLAVWVAVTALSVPNFFVHEIQPVQNYCPNFTKQLEFYTLNISAAALDNGCRFFKWNLWLTGIFFKIVPCVLLLLLIVGLVQKLHEVKQKRDFLLARNRSRRTDRTTLTLTLILGVFLATEVPQGAVAILSALSGKFYNEIYPIIGNFMDLLSLLNCCVSFILYCITSSKYRQTFWQLFGVPPKYYMPANV